MAAAAAAAGDATRRPMLSAGAGPGAGATAVFFTTSGWLGGAERSMLELAVALAAAGRRVHGVFPGEGELARAWRAAGLGLTAVKLPALGRAVLRNPAAALTGAAGTVRGLDALSAAVVAQGPAIVHANSAAAALHAALLVRLKPPANGALVAAVWHCRDLVEWVGFRAAVFPGLAQVIAISDAVRRNLVEFGCPPEKVVLIRNGIVLGASGASGAAAAAAAPGVRGEAAQSRRAAAKKALGFDPRLPVVLHVSQFAPWKKTPLFLEACRVAAERQPLQVLLIGREPPEPGDEDDDDVGGGGGSGGGAMPATIRTGVERLRQAGRTVVAVAVADAARMAQVYAAADVLMHPAVNEPFGRVILEAMAAGVVVLGRSRLGGGGGPAELVVGEGGGAGHAGAQTGVLVTRDEEFAPALVKLLGDAAAREGLAAAAVAEAFRMDAGTGERVHSTARVAREVLSVYAAIGAGGGS